MYEFSWVSMVLPIMVHESKETVVQVRMQSDTKLHSMSTKVLLLHMFSMCSMVGPPTVSIMSVA